MLLMLFLAKDITPSKMQELMQSLSNKIETVQAMMNNLLQWSLLELKHQNNTIAAVYVDKVIENVIAQVQESATQKRLLLQSNLVPCRLMANAEEMEIVIRNLLSNAIKFTPTDGKIQVDITQSEGKVKIEIKDSGIGMAKELLLESNHYPMSSKGTLGEIGTGLGLKICRALVKKNQGQMAIKSSKNEGTEVMLWF